MNRRNFLKILVGAVVVPVALPGIDLLIPAGPIPHSAVIKKARQTGIQAGITNAQLQELIRMTLQDLPKEAFQVNWHIDDYEFTRFYSK